MQQTTIPAIDRSVAEVIKCYPDEIQLKILDIRKLIFELASDDKRIGRITETLKWNEPAYLTDETKSGSTIRLAWSSKRPGRYGVYFICTTNLVEMFRTFHSDELEFEGNRAIIFEADEPIPKQALASCVKHALTYKLAQK